MAENGGKGPIIGGHDNGPEQLGDFWAPRACFLPPIPELATAADLLDEAADALLAGDRDRARARLREADIPAVHAFAARSMGSRDTMIYKRRELERSADLTRALCGMPSGRVKTAVFARDGWRCRYCGVRVVLPKARNVLANAFPDVVCWNGTDRDRHAAFFALSGVADHLVPHALGGGSGIDDFVTTCQCCNYGNHDRPLGEVGSIDPWTGAPVVESWDGLGRLLLILEPQRAQTLRR